MSKTYCSLCHERGIKNPGPRPFKPMTSKLRAYKFSLCSADCDLTSIGAKIRDRCHKTSSYRPKSLLDKFSLNL